MHKGWSKELRGIVTKFGVTITVCSCRGWNAYTHFYQLNENVTVWQILTLRTLWQSLSYFTTSNFDLRLGSIVFVYDQRKWEYVHFRLTPFVLILVWTLNVWLLQKVVIFRKNSCDSSLDQNVRYRSLVHWKILLFLSL